MFGFLKRLFGGAEPSIEAPSRFSIVDLAARLRMDVGDLRSVRISYAILEIPKRTGGRRRISAPVASLKKLQQRILRRVLERLRSHPCATGFERGHSIVTNALPHAGKDIVIRLDIQDFFPSITQKRVERYFRFIGFDAEAAGLLTKVCTHEGSLPQGAPTSPRLSNLVNYRMDARLSALAASRGMSYSRYADDLTFSLGYADHKAAERMNPKTLVKSAIEKPRVNDIIHLVKEILSDEGYRLHTRKKLRIARRHHQQRVTGLVVNERPNLPRALRHRLRAIEHHVQSGRDATLTPAQLAGWRALQAMIARQAAPPQ